MGSGSLLRPDQPSLHASSVSSVSSASLSSTSIVGASLVSRSTPNLVATPGSPLPAAPSGSRAIRNSTQTEAYFVPEALPAMPAAAASNAAAHIVMSNIGASTSALPDGSSAPTASSSSKAAMIGSRRGTRSSRRRSISDHIRNGKGMPVYADADHPLSTAKLEAKGYHSFSCLGVPFYVNKRYKFVRELGIGAYGCVALAKDTTLDCNVAIKKVTRVFERDVLARRALREVAVLRHLSLCDNATVLLDFDAAFIEFGEIYFVLSASEADLSQIIRSGQQLSDAHLQYFTAQILRGVRYMHRANIIHRDLKPGNLLVNADCALRVCDFGLARAYAQPASRNHSRGSSGASSSTNDSGSPDRASSRSSRELARRRKVIPPSRQNSPSALDMAEGFLSNLATPSPSANPTAPVAAAPAENGTVAGATSDAKPKSSAAKMKVRTTRLDFPGGPLTEYVATRWYRAPEIMLCFREGYGPEMDMWSVGCILAELIAGRPIFAGKDYVDQIARINNVLGTPSPETIAKIGSARAKTYVQSLPKMPKVPFANLFPGASPEALDLLDKLLTWDPAQRMSADEALQHPWLKAYHESNARWLAPDPFDRFDEVEMITTLPEFQSALVREAEEMRAELAALDGEALQLDSPLSGDSGTSDSNDTAAQQTRRRARKALSASSSSTGSSGGASDGPAAHDIIEEVDEPAASDASDHSRQSSRNSSVGPHGSEPSGAASSTDGGISSSTSMRSGSRQGGGMSATTYCSSTTTPFSARSEGMDGETEPTSPSACHSNMDGSMKGSHSHYGPTASPDFTHNFEQMALKRQAGTAMFRRRALSNTDPLGEVRSTRLRRSGSSTCLFQGDTFADTFPAHNTDMIRRPSSESTKAPSSATTDGDLSDLMEDELAEREDADEYRGPLRVSSTLQTVIGWPLTQPVYFLNKLLGGAAHSLPGLPGLPANGGSSIGHESHESCQNSSEGTAHGSALSSSILAMGQTHQHPQAAPLASGPIGAA